MWHVIVGEAFSQEVTYEVFLSFFVVNEFTSSNIFNFFPVSGWKSHPGNKSQISAEP